MKKNIYLGFFALLLILTPAVVSAKTGEHTSEEKYLEYEIKYLDPKGITYVHDEGIWFISDDPDLPNTYLTDLLPEEYFGEYPLYFIEDALNFEVHITNMGNENVMHLYVTAIHELLNTDGGVGVPFDGGEFNWAIKNLKKGETKVLTGSMVIPPGSPNGIDQTHLIVTQSPPSVHNDKDDTTGKGDEKIHKQHILIIDDPQAGLWCPVEKTLE